MTKTLMRRTLAAAALSLVALPAAAEILVEHSYALSSNPMAGAVFMELTSTGAADRLVEARGDVAKRIELHTHIMEDGIAKMREVEGGIEIPAGGTTVLKRGGLHVMLMGLATPLAPGDTFPLTLVFESGQETEIEVLLQPNHAGEMVPEENPPKHH